MARAAAFVGAIVCLAGCTALAPAPQPFRIVAYVAGWSLPPVIHAEKLTHINFAFAKIDGDGEIAFEDPSFAPALKSLLALKQRNPQLKVIVSVGGWEAGGFSDAALTEASRNRFAQSAAGLLRAHGADGIDLDWEYPGQGVAGVKYRAEDKRSFTLLLQSVRAKLDAASKAERRSGRDRYALTIASADRVYFAHTEMNELHVYLDWLNIMSYDFFNSLTSTTGHHAGVKPLNHGLNRPYGRYEGDHSYAELADEFIGSQGFVRHWDERAQAPFLWNDARQVFVTYDDPQSIRAKASYARENRLGGIMFWELSQDRDDELLDVIVTSLRPQP